MKRLLQLLRPAHKPRQYLPNVHDDARTQFLNDWWHGIAVGFVSGMGAAVILLKG